MEINTSKKASGSLENIIKFGQIAPLIKLKYL